MSTISASTTSTTAYKVTADTTGALVIQTGASPTTAVTIDSSQNVGIGTSAPATQLHVQNLGGNSESILGQYGTGTRIQVGAYANYTAIRAYNGTNDVLALWTGASERARIDASGNLMVGVTSSGWAGGGNIILGSTAVIEFKGTEGYITQNLYYNGGWKYETTATAGYYYGSGGNHIWGRVVSGTAGAAATLVESARIDTSGNLLVGQTSSGLQNSNSQSFSPAGANVTFNHSNTSGGFAYLVLGYNGSSIGSISQNGTTAVAYNTTSDYRLKENVQPFSGALARVAALKPCTYTWKSAPDEIGEGFIAHELAEVCPQAVTGEKDAVNEDGSIKPQSIDTSFLVATLTAAIQELKAELDAAKADIATLKGAA